MCRARCNLSVRKAEGLAQAVLSRRSALRFLAVHEVLHPWPPACSLTRTVTLAA